MAEESSGQVEAASPLSFDTQKGVVTPFSMSSSTPGRTSDRRAGGGSFSARIASALRSGASPLLTLDAEGRCLYVGTAAADALGLHRASDLLGQTLWGDKAAAAGAQGVVTPEAVRDALATGRSVYREARHEARDRWLEYRIYPAKDGGVTLLLQDITERKQAESLERRNAYRLALIARVSHPPVGHAPLTDQLRTMASEVRRAFGVDACIIRVLDDTDNLALLASDGLPDAVLFPSIPVVEGGLSGEIIEKGRAVTIANTAEHPITSPFRLLGAAGYEFLAYAGAPLLVEGRVTGILGVYVEREPRRFSDTDLEHLQIVANYTAAAVENERLYRALEERTRQLATELSERARWETEREQLLADALDRAERDPLTGLYNHHAFYSRLYEAAAKAHNDGAAGVTLALMDIDNFKFFNDAYGHAVGDRVLQIAADALKACCAVVPQAVAGRVGGDEFALFSTKADVRSLTACLSGDALRIPYNPPGSASELPLRLSFGIASYPQDAATIGEAVALADVRLMGGKRGQFDEETEDARRMMGETTPSFGMLDALVAAVDNKDRYTRRHSEEVFRYAQLTARRLNLTNTELAGLKAASLLHDVGKIGVPDRILRLPTGLTPHEYDIMKRHAELGAMLVTAAGSWDSIVPAVLHHHERWDGAGYPHGLSGEAIPLLARIIAVVDAFSAMTTDRPYRQGMSPEAALAELAAGSGFQWDPACVRAFTEALEEGI